jgi:histidine triad (HIT) family protein
MVFVDDCIFCQIAQKKIPSQIVYEDENFIAFLDIHPANKGHTLVIPKNHVKDLNELKEDAAKELFSIVQRVAYAVQKATNANAFNIIQNNGPAAGQIVSHVHIHIIPRFEKDGLSLGVFRQGKYEGNEIASIANAIKSKIPEKKVEEKIEKVKPEEKEENPKKRSAQQVRHIRKEVEIA